MAKKRAPKYSRFKAEDWNKYVEIKTGTRTYTVARAAPAEDKQIVGVGVVPFGISPSTTANVINHKNATISIAGARMAKSCLGDNFENELGLVVNSTESTSGPAGWYPATTTITLVGKTDQGTRTPSQLSTRSYKKKKTRSGTMPFGRRSIATPNAITGDATAGLGDRDYQDCLQAIIAAINESPTSPGDSKVASKSSEPEIFVPVIAITQWLGKIEDIGSVTNF